MRLLIIEDEPRAANQLQNMLKTCQFEYNLLAILDTVEDAVLWFQQGDTADLIFMDIQLADGLSFEIFQKVDVTAPIIFTTAFDQYAIRAFKVNSVDYLLKPIQQEELTMALHKFEKSNTSNVVTPNVLKELLSSIQAPHKREGILVKEGSGFVQIKISQLLYVYSQESITFGVTAHGRYIIDETMDQLFETLDQTQFYRINRGQIIAKQSIQKVAPYFNHRVKLNISNPRDQEFVVSRQKTTEFKAWLNQ